MPKSFSSIIRADFHFRSLLAAAPIPPSPPSRPSGRFTAAGRTTTRLGGHRVFARSRCRYNGGTDEMYRLRRSLPHRSRWLRRCNDDIILSAVIIRGGRECYRCCCCCCCSCSCRSHSAARAANIIVTRWPAVSLERNLIQASVRRSRKPEINGRGEGEEGGEE